MVRYIYSYNPVKYNILTDEKYRFKEKTFYQQVFYEERVLIESLSNELRDEYIKKLTSDSK